MTYAAAPAATVGTVWRLDRHVDAVIYAGDGNAVAATSSLTGAVWDGRVIGLIRGGQTEAQLEVRSTGAGGVRGRRRTVVRVCPAKSKWLCKKSSTSETEGGCVQDACRKSHALFVDALRSAHLTLRFMCGVLPGLMSVSRAFWFPLSMSGCFTAPLLGPCLPHR